MLTTYSASDEVSLSHARSLLDEFLHLHYPPRLLHLIIFLLLLLLALV
jgi:hypothetical protein